MDSKLEEHGRIPSKMCHLARRYVEYVAHVRYVEYVAHVKCVELNILNILNMLNMCVCVCFLPIHSGHQVRWTYQPGSHRRKVTQDF